MHCLSKIQFGSFLTYSPRGQSSLSKQSRQIISPIKNAKAGYIPDIVKRLSSEMSAGKSSSALRKVLGSDVLVVPCPRSAPLLPGALWPAKEICAALVSHNLAAGVAEILERIKPVQKSSTALSKDRPKPEEHFLTMKLGSQESIFAPISKITVVDDVITRGATLLAAASHLKSRFPNARVQAFALVRTMSYGEIKSIIDPTLGEILLDKNDALRQP